MYRGYLIKNITNGVALDNSILLEKGYKCNPKQLIDADSYRDGTGKLHRTVMQHKPSKLWIKTLSINISKKKHFKTVFPSREIVRLEYYDTEIDGYSQGDFYIPDFDWVIEKINQKTNDITYSSLDVTLVEY